MTEVRTTEIQDVGEHSLAQVGPNMLPAQAAARMAEVQVMAMMARQNPRSVTRALAAIEQACSRQRLAESAEYEYSKGGQSIRGPSVDLIKAIAIEWRNIQYGWEVVAGDATHSVVRAWAYDAERNVPSSITFRVRHWIDLKGGNGRACRDERESYELVANMAARRVRACLENVIPADVVDDAVDWCRRTLAGKSDVPLLDQVKACAAAFAALGVSVEQIEEKLGHSIDATTHSELAKMRRVFKAIKDGVETADYYFLPPKRAQTAEPAKPTMADLADQLAAKVTKPEPERPNPDVFHTDAETKAVLVAGQPEPMPDPASPEGKALSAALDKENAREAKPEAASPAPAPQATRKGKNGTLPGLGGGAA